MNSAARTNRDYARLAWWLIIGAFLLFCLLMIGLCYGAWRIKAFAQSQPAEPATLQNLVSGVDILRKGLAQYELPTPPETLLFEGDAVRVPADVPPGIAATITLFDDSTIELWPGSTIILEKVQTTRFSTRNQQVAIRLKEGLMRLRLAPRATQQYQDVQYTVLVEHPGQPLEQAALDLDGTYRVRVLAATAPTTSASERVTLGTRIETEYVVEKGGMAVGFGQQNTRISAGYRSRVSAGQLGAPLAAEWQFMRDGTFTQFTEREYNNNTVPLSVTDVVRADTWRVYGDPSPGATRDGYFYIVSGCAQRNSTDANTCARPLLNVAQFNRDKDPTVEDHPESFKTAITQTLNLDITPYSSLQITFDGRIYAQSLNKAGFIGEECALGIEIHFTSTSNVPGLHTYCFYARNEPNEPGTESNKDYITSKFIPLRQWQSLTLDLNAIKTKMRRIDYVTFYGNGHDYISEIANVQLVAK